VSDGVLVLGDADDGGLRAGTRELIGAAVALEAPGAGPLALAMIGAGAEAAAEAHAPEAGAAGAQEILAVRTPGAFEAHVWQAALEGLIAACDPAIVLAPHTVDALSFVPAVAARGRHGLAADVVGLDIVDGQLRARRGAYGERLLAELEFPGRETVLLTLRAGAFESGDARAGGPSPARSGEARAGEAAQVRSGESRAGGAARVRRLELDLGDSARSERIELRRPEGELDLDRAEVLLAIGRGAGSAENVPALERLAARLGATLAASGPPVEAGWVSRARKIGQSGRTVAPRVYLALGISGAPQHLAGIARARTVIAVNTDPEARIFDVADHGAVADLFDVAAELERRIG
jgi:electron transfer flavoprotein alpha subunit